MDVDFARSERRSVASGRRARTALGLVVALVASVLSLAAVTLAPAGPAAASAAPLSVISAGNAHTCGITSAGAAMCWGRGNQGQLGTVTAASSSVPVQVSGLTSGVTSISAGSTHTCAVVSGGAWCWGANTGGQLGNAGTTNSTTPVQVYGLTSGVTAIAVGTGHACAVVSGAAKCWGQGTSGKLGNTSTLSSSVPVQVTGLTSGVTAIAAGGNHSCAVVSGAAKCWGLGTSGQLGQGSNSSSSSPVQVSGLTSGATAISAGATHTCAAASGAARCWGANTGYQLGTGTNTASTSPVAVLGLTSGVTGIAAGTVHSCALVSGAARCWGTSTDGQLGSDSTNPGSPAEPSGMASGVTAITAGTGHSCAVRSGVASCWGDNAAGQQGNGMSNYSGTPRTMGDLSSGVTAIASGHDHSCAIASGSGWCWGRGDNGVLDNANGQTTTGTPTKVTGFTSMDALSAGSSYTCARTAGVAKCWGWSQQGNTGDGGVAGQAAVASGTTAVSAGSLHACAVVSGAAKCWGRGTSGQLGNGSNVSSNVAVQVSGLTSGVTAVSAGDLHSCAVVSGAAWCWGANSGGQLGNGTTTASLVPVQVSGLTSGVTAIAAGDVSTCAVVNGSARCWGSNVSWQLGSGLDASSTTPVQVSGLTSGVSAVTVGDGHACALVSGAAQCWGSGNSGRLGNGSTSSSKVPVQVIGLTSGVTAISAGQTHTCAVVSGAAQCWGSGDEAKMGIYLRLPNPVSGGLTWASGSANATPVATATSAYAVPGTPKAITLTGTDAESDALTFAVTEQPTKGTLTCSAAGACTYTGTAGQSGADSFQFTANDGSSTSAAATISLSLSPPAAPTISGSRSPAANVNGWSNEPVTVSFTCGSPVLASCTSPVTVSTDGTDQSASGTATDEFGQTASTTVPGISIDRVAPTLAGLATTAPNAAGWYRAPVTMAWTCDDDRSGISAGVCPSDTTTTGEGGAVTMSAEVNDKAGNRTTATSEAVKVDLTAPSTGVSSPPTWSKDDVTLTLTPTDALSGVATTTYRVDGGPDQTGTRPVVSGQGHHVVTFWSVDEAGNEEAHGSVGVDIDTTAPSIIPHLSPAPNASGWNKGPVDVTFTCSDAGGSGVATCVGDRLFTTQADTTVTGEAADNAGNTASAQSTVRIDLTAPTVTAQVPAANVHGWFDQPVQVPFACSDTGGSGVASCPAPIVFAGEGKDQAVTATGSDLAGNQGAASGSTVSIDTTAPTISGAATTAPNGSGGYTTTATVRWTCDDALSGIVSCPADQVVTGEGTHVIGGSVTDRAGNTTTAQVTIRIDRDTSNDPGIVRGTITDPSGNPVPGASVTLRTMTGAILLSTTTGSDGGYLFASVPDGTYQLYAVRNLAYQGLYFAPSTVVTHGSNQVRNAALPLTLVLSGTVRDSSGAPISGATVRVSPSSLAAVTDASGSYRIEGLLPGSVTVKFVAYGMETSTTSAFTLGADRTLDRSLTASPAGSGLKGIITNRVTGLPVSGATVRIYAKDSGPFSLTVTSGTDGRYSVASLPAGAYEVDVIRGDYQVRWFGDVLSRVSATPIAIPVGCTSAPDLTWGDACATSASVRLG